MTIELRTVGVAVFVLRKHTTDTEVLLLRRRAASAPGDPDRASVEAWSPVAGPIRADETEAQAALRETVEETGARPDRFYAAPFRSENREPAHGPVGRIGIFVAYLDETTPVRVAPNRAESRWLSFAEARTLLPRHAERAALAEIAARFVRRPPDEALRVA